MKAYYSQATAFKTLIVDYSWVLCVSQFDIQESCESCEGMPSAWNLTFHYNRALKPAAFQNLLSGRLIRALALNGMSSSSYLWNKCVCVCGSVISSHLSCGGWFRRTFPPSVSFLSSVHWNLFSEGLYACMFDIYTCEYFCREWKRAEEMQKKLVLSNWLL